MKINQHHAHAQSPAAQAARQTALQKKLPTKRKPAGEPLWA